LYRDSVITPQRHFANHLVKNLDLAFEAVLEARNLRAVEDIKVYKEQDKVMLFNNKISTSRKPRKLSLDWSGPWFITKVISSTRYDLKNCSTDQENLNIHSYYLKPFYE
ncbi:hypothetical protein K501DRAFT_170598, partial [Backusella circina FSU 941]